VCIKNNTVLQFTSAQDEAAKSGFIVGPWSPDGKGFYVISDLQREYASLAFYDTDKSELGWVLTPEHDIELVDRSSDGTTLAWTENVDGYSRVFTKDLRNGKVEEIANLSLNGVIEDLKLSSDGKRMGIMMTTPLTPSDIYVIDIGKGKDNSNNIQKITYSLLGNVPENLLIRPDLIRYRSFDGIEISFF